MVVAGHCSLDCLREGGWSGQLNNNLTGKYAMRKIWNGGKKLKTRGKLTVTIFSTQQAA
jgi:hypothetical protein